jgi:tetratricopeptide (TPR) repeat protein
MQIYSRLKAYPQSIEAGQAVLQRDSIPAVVSYIGDSFNSMKQADSALWYYRRSLALRPMNETTLSKAMGILLGAEDFDGALSLSEPFLELDPDNTTIAPLQGLALYRKEAYKDAIKVFERQLEVGNDSYPIHFYLGQCFWQEKTLYRAEQEFKAAWQIDSTDVGLAYSIAALKSDMYYHFESEIKPWLDKAWEMIQPDPSTASRIQQQYGVGYYRKQDSWDQAIEHYKLAYQYNPKFIQSLSTIGYCYQMKKDFKEALKWYEKYMAVARPGSNGYKFVEENIAFLKAELFMEEGK